MGQPSCFEKSHGDKALDWGGFSPHMKPERSKTDKDAGGGEDPRRQGGMAALVSI